VAGAATHLSAPPRGRKSANSAPLSRWCIGVAPGVNDLLTPQSGYGRRRRAITMKILTKFERQAWQ
jgi:hypothetical protein